MADRFTYHVELKGAAQGLADAVHACMARHGLLRPLHRHVVRYDALVAMREADA